MSGFQKGATYGEIKAYVLEKFGLKVSSLYISQVKRKCGLEVGENYNQNSALSILLRWAFSLASSMAWGTISAPITRRDSYRTLWGRDWLEEELCQLNFRLSVPSFFQVNRAQTQRLYRRELYAPPSTPGTPPAA